MTVLTDQTFSSCFSVFVSSYKFICDVLIKLKPYDGLIGIKTVPWKNTLMTGVSNVILYIAQ